MKREYNIKFSHNEILNILNSIEISIHNEELFIRNNKKYAETDEQFKSFIKDSKDKISILNELFFYISNQYIHGGEK